MHVEPFELQEKISQMSDEELLRMVGVDARQYRQEALDLAKSEMARRGLAFDQQANDQQANSIQCIKCAGLMEEGFIPDYGHYEYVRPLMWVEGKPEKSFWTGTKIGDRRGANIAVYRCTACGYIEFYAREETPS